MSEYILKEIKIEVTHRCPLACVHCSSNAHAQNKKEMSLEKCLKIINEAYQMGVEKIAFSGGEPLCWPSIIEVVTDCTNKGIVTTIYSSGNAPNSEQVFRYLFKAGLSRVVFSLYSCNEDEHNRITRKSDSFKNTISSIKLVKELGINPEVHFVALASNYLSIEKLVQYLRTIGVSRTSILRFVPQGRGLMIKSHDTLSEKQNLELARIIRELRKKGFDIRTGSPFNVLYLNNEPECMAAKDRLIISPDLDIYPCDAFKQVAAEQIQPNPEYSSLKETTLQDCWVKSSYLNEVRKALEAETASPCSKCGAYRSCLAGCLAQKFLMYNSLYKNPDPACLLGGDKSV